MNQFAIVIPFWNENIITFQILKEDLYTLGSNKNYNFLPKANWQMTSLSPPKNGLPQLLVCVGATLSTPTLAGPKLVSNKQFSLASLQTVWRGT